MNILMLSSSKVANEDYLQHAIPMLNQHLSNIKELLFIPFAGVSVSWDDYTTKVQHALPDFQVFGIHECSNAHQALEHAQAILVGGGNTFNLLNELYRQDLLGTVKNQVNKGTPYVGWSAGSNICGNSIRTTNDMPIIQPPSFDALNFVPFQLNPHYTDYQPPGHNGETRAQRIEEFCILNPKMPVIGIREGCALLLQGESLVLKGELDGVVFEGNSQSVIHPNQDLSGYL
ncbi:dipeptidase PepE [Paraglaciecola psychrophila]|jgi:dipeptidase E|uniref:Dipeptidase E n=1 Tax=Paraglaciecola psychrophila 170 TaxID=1129794 RepID=K7AAX9_9ALTE|nr:dipeptidase PepE [Paraglaciecola psychrophila]AGH45338.1 dipeptidase E [Paraglaciecola psychrophila 170]GAC39437.1 dipeptidase E [Paraglaciecola psychrophila 170]